MTNRELYRKELEKAIEQHKKEIDDIYKKWEDILPTLSGFDAGYEWENEMHESTIRLREKAKVLREKYGIEVNK